GRVRPAAPQLRRPPRLRRRQRRGQLHGRGGQPLLGPHLQEATDGGLRRGARTLRAGARAGRVRVPREGAAVRARRPPRAAPRPPAARPAHPGAVVCRRAAPSAGRLRQPPGAAQPAPEQQRPQGSTRLRVSPWKWFVQAGAGPQRAAPPAARRLPLPAAAARAVSAAPSPGQEQRCFVKGTRSQL
ncbi:Protein of unknown function, partial [Gryllus bimaculatus]